MDKQANIARDTLFELMKKYEDKNKLRGLKAHTGGIAYEVYDNYKWRDKFISNRECMQIVQNLMS